MKRPTLCAYEELWVGGQGVTHIKLQEISSIHLSFSSGGVEYPK